MCAYLLSILLLLKFSSLFCDTDFWDNLTLMPPYVHTDPYVWMQYLNVLSILLVYVIVSKKSISNLIDSAYA